MLPSLASSFMQILTQASPIAQIYPPIDNINTATAQSARCAPLGNTKKIGLDADYQMSYSRPLKDSMKWRGDAASPSNYQEIRETIHVDGSAPGLSATTEILRTAKRLAAGMDAGGALRTY